ncbi:MAG: FKBP-type peptidyl-prolyl cis-trans isomerase [Bacteroidetes bacterium]|nr:FKBP-type peptidyl-prolyl cis-trans isomerase [Bacteroidota bacterium]
MGLLLLAACADKKPGTETAKEPAPATTPQVTAETGTPPPYTIADSSQIKKTASGLQYYIVEEGKGNLPKAGQNVLAHYHGMLPNGEIFDSSFDRNTPFTFAVGQGQVIAGWDEAFQLLPVGTKAILIIPGDLAYGSHGSPPKIGPNQTLHFHVQVLGASK